MADQKDYFFEARALMEAVDRLGRPLGAHAQTALLMEIRDLLKPQQPVALEVEVDSAASQRMVRAAGQESSFDRLKPGWNIHGSPNYVEPAGFVTSDGAVIKAEDGTTLPDAEPVQRTGVVVETGQGSILFAEANTWEVVDGEVSVYRDCELLAEYRQWMGIRYARKDEGGPR